jgi:hypothetical protein
MLFDPVSLWYRECKDRARRKEAIKAEIAAMCWGCGGTGHMRWECPLVQGKGRGRKKGGGDGEGEEGEGEEGGGEESEVDEKGKEQEENKNQAFVRRRKLVQAQKDKLAAVDKLGGAVECTVCDPVATFVFSSDTENFNSWCEYLHDSLGVEKIREIRSRVSIRGSNDRLAGWEVHKLHKLHFDVAQSSGKAAEPLLPPPPAAAAAASQGHAKSTRRRTSWIVLVNLVNASC